MHPPVIWVAPWGEGTVLGLRRGADRAGGQLRRHVSRPRPRLGEPERPAIELGHKGIVQILVPDTRARIDHRGHLKGIAKQAPREHDAIERALTRSPRLKFDV